MTRANNGRLYSLNYSDTSWWMAVRLKERFSND